MSDSSASVGTKPPRVFISYTHDSPAHKQRIVDLAAELRRKGIDAWIDRYEPHPPEGWPRWMTDQIERADFVLMVCTEVYCRRFEGRETPGKGLGGTHEGRIIEQAIYKSGGKNRKFVPIQYAGDENVIPTDLWDYTYCRLPDEFEKLYRYLTKQPDVIAPPLGPLEVLPPQRAVLSQPAGAPTGAVPEQAVVSEGALSPEPADPWAAARGEDGYGTWSEVEIFGVVQRFRWIEPGTFLMGSPEDEPERHRNELQHEVELTKGYWLADTACTQQLWQAVTGRNPSEFKGYNLPVEQVSWKDCHSFFEKANRSLPGLNLRFPSEAEWEYACRAGTITPFSFGENITTEQVNFNGNYPYADGEKGEFRKNTVPVKALPPNDWGLHQMHGNVWEWCDDWQGDYPSGRVVDPRGPEKGGYRVLRGGFWRDDGGWCRSAGRLGGHPGSRGGGIGFRLSRGPVEPGQEPGR